MEYQASKKQTQGSGERRVLRPGWSWARWVMVPLVIFEALYLIQNPTSWPAFIVLFVFIGLFLLFRRARRLEHDDKNLYVIRAKKVVKTISFKEINSIKRSAAKVNGERFWIIRYNDGGKERKLRYFRQFFNKEFHKAVKDINPAVVIWTHPHFNH